MRKLPSRGAKTKKNDATNENLVAKTKTKKSLNNNAKTNKNQVRQALADKTNSGSDLNQSPLSISPIHSRDSSRPKRTHKLPSKFLNHELNISPKPKVRTSTPLKNDAKPQNNKETTDNKNNIENTPKVNPIVKTKRFKSPARTISKIERPKRMVKKVNETPKTSKIDLTSSSTEEIRKTSLKRASTPKNAASKSDGTKSINKKCNISSGAQQIPIYNNISNFNNSQENVSNKLELYEFQFDPENEPVKQKKKRVIKKTRTTRKKKVLSDSSSDNAMRMLLEDLKKIQAANLLKKLRLKKKLQNNAVAAETPILNTNVNPEPEHVFDSNNEIPNDIHSPPGSPLSDNMDMHPSPPPSPILFAERNKTRSLNDFHASNVNCSANLSNKPSSSPWRMELKTDKKWPYNFSVKASMTPAYERDTVHVFSLDHPVERPKKYGNMLELLTSTPTVQDTADKPVRNLKQASILSFYETSINKSLRKKSMSPKKKSKIAAEHSSENELFEAGNVDVPEVEASKENEVDAVGDCFGFEDDSAEFDQENVSPSKLKSAVAKMKNILKPKNKIRVPLKENNAIKKGPARITPSEVRNILVANKANIISEKVSEKQSDNNLALLAQSNTSTDSENSAAENTNDDTQEKETEKDVALFEDPMEIELVHSVKPNRKIYEKRTRPVVRFKEVEEYVDTEKVISDPESDQEEFADEKYVSKKKKIKKKQTHKQLSKKEVKEAEVWAAGFNSLLEEAEEFELCIE